MYRGITTFKRTKCDKKLEVTIGCMRKQKCQNTSASIAAGCSLQSGMRTVHQPSQGKQQRITCPHAVSKKDSSPETLAQTFLKYKK